MENNSISEHIYKGELLFGGGGQKYLKDQDHIAFLDVGSRGLETPPVETVVKLQYDEHSSIKKVWYDDKLVYKED